MLLNTQDFKTFPHYVGILDCLGNANKRFDHMFVEAFANILGEIVEIMG